MMEWILKFWIATWSLLAILFGTWTIWGLSDSSKRPENRPTKKVLGVCADFSVQAKMPLWFVRMCAVLFIPLLLGIVFYLAYYWAILQRRPKEPPTPKQKPPAKSHDVQITRMDSYHF